MMLKKKLVGSTGSPLGRAGVRCEGGGGCRGVGVGALEDPYFIGGLSIGHCWRYNLSIIMERDGLF